MPSLTPSQKALVAQFVQATGTNDKIAQRFLKNAGYKLDVAADAYFSSNPSLAPASSQTEGKLDKLFSDLRNPDEDGTDELSAESVMKYAAALGVNPEDVGIFVLMELVQAPSLGVISRKGFIDGWKRTDGPPTKAGQKDYIQRAIRSLPTDAELFKRVYRYAFVAGKETPEQRAIPLDNAIVYWQCFFTRPGRPWVSSPSSDGGAVDWLPLWTAYLQRNWTRTVSRDMWNQAHDFALKSTADPRLGFWSPDGAWPSVIDGFVEWVRAGPPQAASAAASAAASGPVSSMDVDGP